MMISRLFLFCFFSGTFCFHLQKTKRDHITTINLKKLDKVQGKIFDGIDFTNNNETQYLEPFIRELISKQSTTFSDDEDQNVTGSGDEIESSGDNSVSIDNISEKINGAKAMETPTIKTTSTMSSSRNTVSSRHTMPWRAEHNSYFIPTEISTGLSNKLFAIKHEYNEKKTMHIYYHGPCIFCKKPKESFAMQVKRKRIRQQLVNFDFAVLVHKHPSGLFTTLLSFELGRTDFPDHIFVQLHTPLSCGCFTAAANTRYLLIGEIYHGKMMLNNFYPLYEIHSYRDVEEVQRAFKKINDKRL